MPMSGIFPAVQPAASDTVFKLPRAQEIAWDFSAGTPIFSAGQPVIVTGADAVKVWCWKALVTPRFHHDIYTWNYGSEVGDIIGQAYTADVKRSEAVRFVREALMVSPYVTAVRQVAVEFSGDSLTISCAIETMYGEVSLHV